MTHLNLTRPLAFLDLETTGINLSLDRIIEVAVIKVMPDGQRKSFVSRVNPEMPIPASSSAVHGIFDEDVKDEPVFSIVAPKLNEFLKDCDLAGYNSNKFDIPLLAEEFLRVGVDFDIRGRKLIDVQNIFHMMEPRNLSAAYRFYCQKDLENAHSAEADAVATADILDQQIAKYDNLKPDVNFLADFSSRFSSADLAGRIVFNKEGIEIFNFGKHKDKIVEEVFKKEPSYYDWMMKGDFPRYTKKVITSIRLRSAASLNTSENKLF